MPKRIVDGNALWMCDSLVLLPLSYRAEVANLLPLASDNGTFEYSPRAIWRLVYAFNRPDWTLEMVEGLLNELIKIGLLVIFDRNGKQFGFFRGMEGAGRLPPRTKRHSVAIDLSDDELSLLLSGSNLAVPSRYPQGTAEVPSGYLHGTAALQKSSPDLDLEFDSDQELEFDSDLIRTASQKTDKIRNDQNSSHSSPVQEEKKEKTDQAKRVTLGSVTPKSKGKVNPDQQPKTNPLTVNLSQADREVQSLAQQFAKHEGLNGHDDLTFHIKKLDALLKDKGDSVLISKLIDFAWEGEYKGDGRTKGDPFLRSQADHPIGLFCSDKYFGDLSSKYRRSARSKSSTAFSQQPSEWDDPIPGDPISDQFPERSADETWDDPLPAHFMINEEN